MLQNSLFPIQTYEIEMLITTVWLNKKLYTYLW